MGGASLCTNDRFRERLAGLAAPFDQVNASDFSKIAQKFGLDRPENRPLQERLDRFQSKYFGPTEAETPRLMPNKIRDEFISILEESATKANRKSAYGLFATLFGEGAWEDCFPRLAALRKKIEQEISKRARASGKSRAFHVQDFNSLSHTWLWDVGSALRCYAWGNEARQFACGHASSGTEENVTVLRFQNITSGRCPEGERGGFDGRKTAAVFISCIENFFHNFFIMNASVAYELKNEFGTDGKFVPDSLTDTASFLVTHHEVAHSGERYIDNYFMNAIRRSPDGESAYRFHCIARELYADAYALDQYRLAMAFSLQGPFSWERGLLVYGVFRRTALTQADTCERTLFESVSEFIGKARQENGGWNLSYANERLSQIRSLLKEYDRELRAWVDRKLNPYHVRAAEILKRPEIARLDPIIQEEQVANEKVRLFLADPPSDPETLDFLKNWESRFSRFVF